MNSLFVLDCDITDLILKQKKLFLCIAVVLTTSFSSNMYNIFFHSKISKIVILYSIVGMNN